MSNHDFRNDVVSERMGAMCAYRWQEDPKTILFVLARYKWVSKMLAGYKSVLEVGCADGWGARIVRQTVGELTGLDIDAQMIADARANQSRRWPINFIRGEMMNMHPGMRFDAAYCLDVLEHLEPGDTEAFLERMAFLAPVGIVGMPSLESQEFASPLSAANHINCMTEAELRAWMQKYYKHVFMFTMNDEMVGTGFAPMAHYRFALGVK